MKILMAILGIPVIIALAVLTLQVYLLGYNLLALLCLTHMIGAIILTHVAVANN
jgi:hypothetical protein